VLAQGRSTPFAAASLTAAWPHPPQQDRLVKTGPDDAADLAFLWQHLPLRQQEGIESLNVPAATGPREANKNRNAVYAATRLRIPYQPCFAPSIPGTTLYHARVARRNCGFSGRDNRHTE
jgi:hypothetical protein